MALSRPLLYGGLIVIVAAVYFWPSSSPTPAAQRPGAKANAGKNKERDWTFLASDFGPRFDKPQGKTRDIFNPLFYVEHAAPKTNQDQIMEVPANLAQGEAGWAYTGMAEVDGKRLALLENSSTHQGGFVKEGEAWKRSHIVSITSESIILVGPDGSEETVYRYDPNRPAKQKAATAAPDAGFQPVDVGPALRGPIGANFEISPESVPANEVRADRP